MKKYVTCLSAILVAIFFFSMLAFGQEKKELSEAEKKIYQQKLSEMKKKQMEQHLQDRCNLNIYFSQESRYKLA